MEEENNNLSEVHYDAMLGFKNGKYVFFIEELNAIATGNSLQEAHERLIKKKESIFIDYQNAGKMHLLPPPEKDRLKKNIPYSGTDKTPSGFLAFTVKLLIAAVGVSLVFFFINKETIGKFEEMSKINPVKELQRQVKMSVNSDFDLKEREEVIKDIRVLVARYKPVFDEIAPLFQGRDKIALDSGVTKNQSRPLGSKSDIDKQ